ncbi:MAG: replicative DNA helicase [Marmoricola sp.]
MSEQPASQRAEEFLLSALLREPTVTSEIVGSMLEPEHFYYRPYRMIFEEVVERHFADETIDALLIAEKVSKQIAGPWGVTEREAVDKILELRNVLPGDTASPLEHAAIIKRHADLRALLDLAQRLTKAVQEEREEPEQIASALSADAMRIATDTLIRHESHTYGELGKRFVVQMKQKMAMREAGVEIGARYGIPAIDDFTNGHQPGELMILGGPPGAGKSAISWAMARNFARRQMKQPEDQRVGTLILSMEMGEEQSAARMAQAAGKVEGEKIRTGSLSRQELQDVAMAWARERELPLYANHSGYLRESQLRAIVVEAIRRWNVGVVIIDHFKFIKTDGYFGSTNETDDEIVMFLKALAKDLNTAVVCLAHTVKSVNTADKRPRMEDLRGSGMIAAFADFVGLVHRPFEHATAQQREQGQTGKEDAEMIWAKSRHAGSGTGEFYMDLSTMTVR